MTTNTGGGGEGKLKEYILNDLLYQTPFHNWIKQPNYAAKVCCNFSIQIWNEVIISGIPMGL